MGVPGGCALGHTARVTSLRLRILHSQIWLALGIPFSACRRYGAVSGLVIGLRDAVSCPGGRQLLDRDGESPDH